MRSCACSQVGRGGIFFFIRASDKYIESMRENEKKAKNDECHSVIMYFFVWGGDSEGEDEREREAQSHGLVGGSTMGRRAPKTTRRMIQHNTISKRRGGSE
jgi:hypothetical protein